MKIDPKIEDLAREALAAAVGREPDRLRTAFLAIKDDVISTQVTQLVLAELGVGIERVYRGTPNEEQTAELAGWVAESEKWSGARKEEIQSLLESVCTQAQLTLAPDRIALTLFVTTGYVLSSFVSDIGVNSWYAFLDSILSQLATESGENTPRTTI